MKIISKKARESARGETCALRLDGCNHDCDTTVLAHLRMFGWAGTGTKPPDFLAVYACSSCHDALDRRSGKRVSAADILRALGETQMKLFRKGILMMDSTESDYSSMKCLSCGRAFISRGRQHRLCRHCRRKSDA